MHKSVWIVALLILLNGCKLFPKTMHDSHSNLSGPQMTADPGDPAETTLAEAAVSVSQSLNEMVEIKKASTPLYNRKMPESQYAIPGVVSIDWSGPVEPLLKKLVQIPDYRLRVTGRRVGLPVIVTVTAHETPLSDVLRDIDFQASDRASVRVYHTQRIIELRYEQLPHQVMMKPHAKTSE